MKCHGINRRLKPKNKYTRTHTKNTEKHKQNLTKAISETAGESERERDAENCAILKALIENQTSKYSMQREWMLARDDTGAVIAVAAAASVVASFERFHTKNSYNKLGKFGNSIFEQARASIGDYTLSQPTHSMFTIGSYDSFFSGFVFVVYLLFFLLLFFAFNVPIYRHHCRLWICCFFLRLQFHLKCVVKFAAIKMYKSRLTNSFCIHIMHVKLHRHNDMSVRKDTERMKCLVLYDTYI